MLEITVYETNGEIAYTFTGTQEQIQNEISLLDPHVEYSVEEVAQ